MTTLNASIHFEDDEHQQAVIKVQTSRCWYNVAIRKLDVTVIGPGIEESFNFAEGELPFDCLSFKGLAIIAVTLIEERE